MTVKVKSSTFIDILQFEVTAAMPGSLKAVLRDEKGGVCGEMEVSVRRASPDITWKGLNELPYGVYTLELSLGDQRTMLRMVKRV